jgi:hypothetical protein
VPERGRVFTLSETVARALARAPALTGRVHRFSSVTSLDLPPRGLFVARVPDGVWSCGPDRDPSFERADAWGAGRPVLDSRAARSRLPWLERVWPAEACLRFLRGVATAGHPLGYYHMMERGDFLYYEFGWLAGADEALVARQTVTYDPDDPRSLELRGGRPVPAPDRSAFEAVLAHIGVAATAQFFWPEDELDEDDWPPLDG